MKMVPIKEAKDRLSELTRAAEAGERVVITRNGKPVADLIKHRREGGLDLASLAEWKAARGIGRFFGEMAPDFDDALPADFLITPGR